MMQPAVALHDAALRPGGLSDALVECVPNFSEGRSPQVVRAILDAMHLPGVVLLDYSMDRDHHRSVITIAGSPAAVCEAAVRGAGVAAERIDLTRQKGAHPRIGAADVIPFVPIRGIELVQCAVLAREAASELWDRYRVPSYLYEAAASRPDRMLLEDVRRGQFEGLREQVLRDPSRRPDVGGPGLHPTAGASAVGARRLLIAYNIFLDTADVSIARAIAREVRAASGGLAGVKALGLLVEGVAQVSLNITDFRQAGVATVYSAVSAAAARLGAKPAWGELIGMIPEAAFEPESDWVAQLRGFEPDRHILERRLKQPADWPTD
jgi:glutamate formiminotransferase